MSIKHVTVFGAPGVYCGWPANHGHWQWGDELLFGFIRGRHAVHRGMHNVGGDLEKVLARSLDGGETWNVEVPNVDFEAERLKGPPWPILRTGLPERDPILRVCGDYDHGGEYADKRGGFYLSYDRGKSWNGAFPFNGIELDLRKQHATSRTCVLDDLIFLSLADNNHWGSDVTYCARIVGDWFEPVSIVLDDAARAVMPAAARVGQSLGARGTQRIVVALRRRGGGRPGGWIDTVFSDDEGETWSKPVHVAETGKDNGNPPALIEHNGHLYCAYGNRSNHTIEVMRSSDGAYSWYAFEELRRGNEPDIGYPRLFKRSDGKLVCVYYWTEEFESPQRIEATIFDV